MKKYTFRVSQDLLAYYNALVSIEASSEKSARNKLEKMSTQKLSEIAFEWEQVTDNATPDGEITIQELIENN